MEMEDAISVIQSQVKDAVETRKRLADTQEELQRVQAQNVKLRRIKTRMQAILNGSGEQENEETDDESGEKKKEETDDESEWNDDGTSAEEPTERVYDRWTLDQAHALNTAVERYGQEWRTIKRANISVLSERTIRGLEKRWKTKAQKKLHAESGTSKPRKLPLPIRSTRTVRAMSELYPTYTKGRLPHARA